MAQKLEISYQYTGTRVFNGGNTQTSLSLVTLHAKAALQDDRARVPRLEYVIARCKNEVTISTVEVIV